MIKEKLMENIQEMKIIIVAISMVIGDILIELKELERALSSFKKKNIRICIIQMTMLTMLFILHSALL